MIVNTGSLMRGLPLLLVVLGCPATSPPVGPLQPASQPASSDEQALAAIRTIHGGVGPWVVLGHRMGVHALGVLGLPSGSFDLEVVHHGPEAVQYACVADGAAAATGVSAGKLNLRLQIADAADVRTTFRNRKTGASVTLAPTESFIARFKDIPREHLEPAGREVLHLSQADVFRILP